MVLIAHFAVFAIDVFSHGVCDVRCVGFDVGFGVAFALGWHCTLVFNAMRVHHTLCLLGLHT